jgi:glycosyl transferase family 2
MSVIITTIGGFESIRTVIEHLKMQTVADRLEVIIISPSMRLTAAEEAELNHFSNSIIMEADMDNGLSDAWVDAVNESSAPIVAFGENHAFPVPQWAEALIEAHDGPWAGVGSVIRNANPKSINSRAQLYMTYGRWTGPIESGETEDLPGHNSSYKRSILLEYGSGLKHMLVRTNIMNMDLRARGYRLYMEKRAEVIHINVSKTSSILPDLFYNGQLYIASLVHYKRWSVLKKIFHALLEPLIILRHFQGTMQSLDRDGQKKNLVPAALPIIIAGLTAHLFGKLKGYAAGFGNAQKKINSYEFDRFKHLTREDIAELSKL